MRDRAGMYGANVRRWRFQVTSYAAACAKAATKTDLRVRRQRESACRRPPHVASKTAVANRVERLHAPLGDSESAHSDTCNKIRGLVSGAHGASEDIGSSGLRFRAEVGQQCSD